jgi:putative DNA primase/helicase
VSDLRADVEAAIAERHPEPIGGGEQRFLCPAHDDHNPSARYSFEKGVWRCDVCGAGGGYVDLAKRLGLNLNGHGGKPKGGKGKIVDTYAYVDEAGDLLFQVVRFEPKDFRQRKPDGQGGWVWSLKGTRRVLYNLPEVLKAVKEKRFIFLVEGEKDADNLTAHGFVATTAPQGAGKWLKGYSDTLKGARIALIPDRDEAGEKHRETVSNSKKY